jgi:phage-related protein
MKWKIEFYNEKVKTQTLSLPAGIKAKLLQIFDTIEEFGPHTLGKPHIAPIGKGLYEIRAKGKEGIARSFYCSISGKRIKILHSIIKKSNKPPKKDLDLVISRMKEVQND